MLVSCCGSGWTSRIPHMDEPMSPMPTFRPVAAIHDDAATAMFDQLEAWSAALKPLRKP